MQRIKEYREYFKHQAISHPELHHTDEARVFELIGIEEALADYRTKGQPKGYVFRLFFYTTVELRTDERVLQGGFQILKYHSTRKDGKEGIIQAMNDSERIGYEIIAKIITDSINGHPLFGGYADNPSQLDLNVSPQLYAGDTGYSGWTFTFNFANAICTNSTSPDAPNWADDGLTPY